ncbi:prevent-host-death family protein [Glycomyces sambucus]|uniref:Prevent-host-death family protein n=2 Tax=Glycomyces sambucus TaxID=380244 RepID=A0A1G9DZ71_9ACTN|nr:prevent-host-death family protein [Glycomyces sambucus]
MRELNQHTAQVLAHVEAGEAVTVTKNGRPIAVIQPVDTPSEPVYGFRTDPMGDDDKAPVFNGHPLFAERVDDWLTGFGSDDY